MDKNNIREVKLTLCSDADLQHRQSLEKVLELVELPHLMPEHMGFSELQKMPYSAESVRNELVEKLHFGLDVTRNKTVRYNGQIMAGPEPEITIDFHNSISKKNIIDIFSWSDDLARVFTPEAGTLTIVPKLPAKATADLRFEQAFRAGFLSGGTHPLYGPKLGMVTWLGKRHVDAIGLDNLKATPMLSVEETLSGGVKLILGEVQCPWEMDIDAWVNAWHAAMDHLRQFHVFAYSVIDGKRVRVYRGKNCETPRPDGKVRDITSYLAPEDRPK